MIISWLLHAGGFMSAKSERPFAFAVTSVGPSGITFITESATGKIAYEIHVEQHGTAPVLSRVKYCCTGECADPMKCGH